MLSAFSRRERTWLIIISAGLLLLWGGRSLVVSGFPPIRLLAPQQALAAVEPTQPAAAQANAAELTRPAAQADAVELTQPAAELADAAELTQPAAELADAAELTQPANERVAAAANPAPSTNDHPFPIDINTADEAQLTLLPGIGPVLAARIVAYRNTFGLFRHPDELLLVKGIGAARLKRIKGLVTVSSVSQ